MAYVERLVKQHDLAGKRVLEIGSYNVNGSVRPLFGNPVYDDSVNYRENRYVGIDIREGPGVDLVRPARKIDDDFPCGWADVVVCCEMLEHDSSFWETLRNIAWVLARGGRAIITTRGIGFPLHEHPSDYWRFTTMAAQDVFPLYAGLENVEVEEDPQVSGVFLTGTRRSRGP
jgi:hypothetical protein